MGIIEHARDIAELVKKYNDQELYERIVVLREEILKLREDNIRLHEELKILTDAAAVRDEIVQDGNCYYRKNDESREYPYCLTCWDYEQKLVGLILGTRTFDRSKTITCNVCTARK
jgi:hypothetical protein